MAAAGRPGDFVARKEDNRDGVNEKYFLRWRAARERWVSRAYFERIAARFEERVAPFGYSLRRLTEDERERTAMAGRAGGNLLAGAWCHAHRGAGAVRRTVLKGGKRARNKALAALGLARRRRSAVTRRRTGPRRARRRGA